MERVYKEDEVYNIYGDCPMNATDPKKNKSYIDQQKDYWIEEKPGCKPRSWGIKEKN